jgi:hypothetical protein
MTSGRRPSSPIDMDVCGGLAKLSTLEGMQVGTSESRITERLAVQEGKKPPRRVATSEYDADDEER